MLVILIQFKNFRILCIVFKKFLLLLRGKALDTLQFIDSFLKKSPKKPKKPGHACALFNNVSFLGAQAKQGASNSLIIPEDKDDQGKTSAFLPLRAMLLETL